MKKLTIYMIVPALLIISCNTSTVKDDEKYDTSAVQYLDSLSETIGKLNSCSFTINIFISTSSGVERRHEHDVYMRGPDKLHIYSNGKTGRKSFWYNGKQFSYFSYDNNAYDMIDAPDNIIATIDFVNDKYGIDFPASDFFYPTFTDDILADYTQVLLNEDEVIDNVNYEVIEALNESETVHIWIDKSTQLPYKLIIENESIADEYYEAVLSNWKINPKLTDLLFEFKPPTNSIKEVFTNKSQ
jgi:hypothetical protein